MLGKNVSETLHRFSFTDYAYEYYKITKNIINKMNIILVINLVMFFLINVINKKILNFSLKYWIPKKCCIF